jgi:hypothetical protein
MQFSRLAFSDILCGEQRLLAYEGRGAELPKSREEPERREAKAASKERGTEKDAFPTRQQRQEREAEDRRKEQKRVDEIDRMIRAQGRSPEDLDPNERALLLKSKAVVDGVVTTMFRDMNALRAKQRNSVLPNPNESRKQAERWAQPLLAGSAEEQWLQVKGFIEYWTKNPPPAGDFFTRGMYAHIIRACGKAAGPAMLEVVRKVGVTDDFEVNSDDWENVQDFITLTYSALQDKPAASAAKLVVMDGSVHEKVQYALGASLLGAQDEDTRFSRQLTGLSTVADFHRPEGSPEGFLALLSHIDSEAYAPVVDAAAETSGQSAETGSSTTESLVTGWLRLGQSEQTKPESAAHRMDVKSRLCRALESGNPTAMRNAITTITLFLDRSESADVEGWARSAFRDTVHSVIEKMSREEHASTQDVDSLAALSIRLWNSDDIERYVREAEQGPLDSTAKARTISESVRADWFRGDMTPARTDRQLSGLHSAVNHAPVPSMRYETIVQYILALEVLCREAKMPVPMKTVILKHVQSLDVILHDDSNRRIYELRSVPETILESIASFEERSASNE